MGPSAAGASRELCAVGGNSPELAERALTLLERRIPQSVELRAVGGCPHSQ